MNRLGVCLILLLNLFIASCSPLVLTEQAEAVDMIALEQGKTVGQTFMARFDGLGGAAIYLKPAKSGDGSLRLSLHPAPSSAIESAPLTTLASSSLQLSHVTAPRHYRFEFPALGRSARGDYYLQLEVVGSGSVQVATTSASAYPYGAFYRNGAAQDAQLAFRLVYDQLKLLTGLLREGLFWLALLAAGFTLYILPGWGLGSILLASWQTKNWIEKMALSGGLSLATYPLLFLWSDVLDLHLGAVYAWAPALLSAALLTWRKLAGRPKRQLEGIQPSSQAGDRAFWPDLTVLLLTGLVALTRFYPVRLLPLPLWGDSYQHTLIVQLLVEQGGLFNSWAPYAQIPTFTYHFGFHTLAAVLHWLSRLPAPQATLWSGQLINILAVFCLYPLALRVGRSRWAGAAAILVGGLLSPMPSQYANWGRYTQLAGLVILVTAACLIWECLETRRNQRGLLALVSLALSGLALTHFRVLFLAGLFLLAYVLVYARRDNLLEITKKTMIFAAGGALLFLPWFIHVFSGRIMTILSYTVSNAGKVGVSESTPLSGTGNLVQYLPALAWLGLPLALGWGLWRREKGAALIGIWWLLNWVAGEPGWYGLPGTGAITLFAVLIAAYIPAALFFGGATGWTLEHLGSPGTAGQKANQQIPAAASNTRFWRNVLSPLVLLALSAAGLYGFQQRLEDIQIEESALALPPDQRAAEWMRVHTPPESVFLTNGVIAFENSAVGGTDGGLWLPLLAERRVLLPPLSYVFEQDIKPDFRETIVALYAQLQENGFDQPGSLAALQQQGITHIYIGQQRGRVSLVPVQPINPDQLLSSPHYRPIYHQDLVWVFEVNYAPAAP